MENFILKEGIYIPDAKGAESCFCVADEENIVASVSCEKLCGLTTEAVKALKGDLFFFAEVPCTEAEEKELGGGLHRNVYYLDNCTMEVCLAIIKRYGDLLFADGLLEFGFGSLKDNSEIYLRKYQVVNIYSPEIKTFEGIFEGLGIKKADEVFTLWDLICEKNPGECVLVEANGETIYDMIDNLSEAGLYKSHVADDQ